MPIEVSASDLIDRRNREPVPDYGDVRALRLPSSRRRVRLYGHNSKNPDVGCRRAITAPHTGERDRRRDAKINAVNIRRP